MGALFTIYDKEESGNLSSIVMNAMTIMKNESFEYSDHIVKEHFGMSCQLNFTTEESKNETLPSYDEESSCYITADARVDYREELSEKLGLDWENSRIYPDSKFILLSYLKWGENCVDFLHGDFAFTIWDTRSNQMFCARDRFGCRPLYFIDHPKYFVVTSNPTAIKSIPAFNLRVRTDYILDAICSIFPNKKCSAFAEVRRVEPAHTLKYRKDNSFTLRKYWVLKLQKKYLSLNENEASLELRSRIIESVRQRSRTIGQIGIELSGGLDSSGIASVLMRILDNGVSVLAFTHSRSDDDELKQTDFVSELKFSRYICKELLIDKHCIVSEKEQYGNYPSLIEYLGSVLRPVNENFALMSDLLIKEVAVSGTKVLLSGFGGDEGITFNGSIIFDEFARKGEYKRLKEAISIFIYKYGGNFRRKLLKHLVKGILPNIYAYFKSDWRKGTYNSIAINKDIALKYKMKKRFFTNSYLPEVPDLRIRQFNRLMHAYISERLEESNFIAQIEGVEYRYPYLDVKLIEFFYSLPSELKYKDGIGRFLYRESLRGILPEKVRMRADKTGITIPNVIIRLLQDEMQYRNIITEGKLNNKYHYVDYEKLLYILNHFKTTNKNEIASSIAPRSFLNPISVLILQKWQREGKIDIGIKC